MIHSVESFRSYIYGRPITIITDHQPLVWFKTADLNTRVQKWRFKLSEYDYNVIYKPGKLNSNADALSRNPTEEVMADKPAEDNKVVACLKTIDNKNAIISYVTIRLADSHINLLLDTACPFNIIKISSIPNNYDQEISSNSSLKGIDISNCISRYNKIVHCRYINYLLCYR